MGLFAEAVLVSCISIVGLAEGSGLGVGVGVGSGVAVGVAVGVGKGNEGKGMPFAIVVTRSTFAEEKVGKLAIQAYADSKTIADSKLNSLRFIEAPNLPLLNCYAVVLGGVNLRVLNLWGISR